MANFNYLVHPVVTILVCTIWTASVENATNARAVCETFIDSNPDLITAILPRFDKCHFEPFSKCSNIANFGELIARNLVPIWGGPYPVIHQQAGTNFSLQTQDKLLPGSCHTVRWLYRSIPFSSGREATISVSEFESQFVRQIFPTPRSGNCLIPERSRWIMRKRNFSPPWHSEIASRFRIQAAITFN